MRIAITCVALSLGLALVPTRSAAQTWITVPISGELTDDTGAPLDGTFEMTFAFHEGADGATPVYTETRSVAVHEGIFVVLVGELMPLDATTLAATATLHVEILVEGTILAPRLPIATAPYAAHAIVAADAARAGGLVVTDLAPASHGHTWADVDAPATFPPSPHGHDWSDITGLPIAFPPSPHRHAWADLDAVPPDIADGDADAGGDVSAVLAGAGLSGGGSTGDVTLGIGDGLVGSTELADGTVAFADVDPAAPVVRRTEPAITPTTPCLSDVYRSGTYYYARTTWVTCPNPAGGGVSTCTCPTDYVLTGVEMYNPADSVSSDADRIYAIECAPIAY